MPSPISFTPMTRQALPHHERDHDGHARPERADEDEHGHREDLVARGEAGLRDRGGRADRQRQVLRVERRQRDADRHGAPGGEFGSSAGPSPRGRARHCCAASGTSSAPMIGTGLSATTTANERTCPIASAMARQPPSTTAVPDHPPRVDDEFFVVARNYTFHLDTTVWGWIHLILGVVLLLTGFGLFRRSAWAGVAAIWLAMLSALLNFFSIPYYPVWAIVVIALDVWVIWALTRPGAIDT
jgi:hypothetical protein